MMWAGALSCGVRNFAPLKYSVGVTYSTVLLDFDHTLFDFDAAEPVAFAQTLRGCGVPDPDRYLDTYHAINRDLWSRVERGLIAPNEVHTSRFERLVQTTDLDVDPHALADSYLIAMGANGELYPGTRAVLGQLAQSASLALITNGLREIQRTRIERLEVGQYFDAIVISTEVGSSKPDPKIFDVAFGRLGGPEKSDAIIVGDSLASDIRGGNDYGIATCWYNPGGAAPEGGYHATYQISSLDQLLPLVASADRDR